MSGIRRTDEEEMLEQLKRSSRHMQFLFNLMKRIATNDIYSEKEEKNQLTKMNSQFKECKTSDERRKLKEKIKITRAGWVLRRLEAEKATKYVKALAINKGILDSKGNFIIKPKDYFDDNISEGR